MESRISAHDSVKTMQEKLKKDGVTTVWDRWAAQEQVRCKSFCAKGLSCQFCSNGPCRIIPGKLERGACGMDGDGMAMRYMLLRNAMGLSTYTYHAREVALTLIATGEGKTPFSIRDESKLRFLGDAFGLDASGPAQKLAVDVGKAILAEINCDPRQGLRVIPKFATKGRISLWKKLGLFPGGPANEQIDAISHCLTNVDGDYVSLAKTALRLSISCIYGSLIPLEYGQDILFGTPRPHAMNFDLALLDPAYVNIVVNGHEPFIGLALIKHCSNPEVQDEAIKAGAKGVRVIGSIETGQEILQRTEMSPVFVGMTGNWLSIEPLIATEAVDLFAMDMNCCPPSLEVYAKIYPSAFVSVSPLVNIPGIEKHIDYKPDEVTSQAAQLASMAIDNFKVRKGRGFVMSQPTQQGIVGFSKESILEALGGSLAPLLSAVKSGKIKGIVALISCTTLGNGPQDVPTIAIARELIKRDILVLSMGCGNAAVQVGGLCTDQARGLAGEGLRSVCAALGIPPVLSFGTCSDTGRASVLVAAVADALGVDVPDLPIAVTAPQYMEQKATIDAVFALAFGTFTHVSPTPPLVGGVRLMKLLSTDLEGLTGGKIYLENDMIKAAEAIEKHILAKRAALGIG
jgi:carbon-monoxide dehydrogenase catalytic subunit